MTDRLHLAMLWDGPPCAGEDCCCPRCVAAFDDPSAAAVLAALDATRRDLATLCASPSSGAASPSSGAPSMPEDLRADVLAAAAALRHDAGPPQPGTLLPRADLRPTGRRPRARRGADRRSRVAQVAVLAAAAIVVGIVGRPPAPTPAPTDPTRHALVGTPEPGSGPLADPARQAACLAAVGVPPVTALATRDAAVGGTPGVLLVLPTGTVGTYRVLVVDTACTRVLADHTLVR